MHPKPHNKWEETFYTKGFPPQLKAKMGFSLIEVIIALAIFGISVVVLSQSFLNGFLALESVQIENTYAAEKAHILEEIKKTQDKEALEEGGKLATLGKETLEWKVVAFKASKVLDIFEYTVEIQLPEEKKQKVSILVKNPSLYEDGEREKLLEKKRKKIEERRETLS